MTTASHFARHAELRSAVRPVAVMAVAALLGCSDAVAPPAPLTAPDGGPHAALVPATGFGLVQVDAGDSHSCGVTARGQAYCWGDNITGQLGVGIYGGVEHVPVAVLNPPAGILSFTSVSAGATHTCAIAQGGAAYCWGAGDFGQLGTGLSGRPYPLPVLPPAGSAEPLVFTSLSAGLTYTCGIAKGGQLFCWGANSGGRTGIGSEDGYQFAPTPVASAAQFSSVSTGAYHACGLAKGGAGYCWGFNKFGELGTGAVLTVDLFTVLAPVPVGPPAGETKPLAFTSISAGGDHTCAVAKGGQGYCWGENSSEALGNVSAGPFENSPFPVDGGLSLASVSAGLDFTCAVAKGGTGYCWGENEVGQLGRGITGNPSSVPSPVVGLFTFLSVSAGRQHACAVTKDRGAYCWGDDTYGQLGNGALGATAAPSPVAAPPDPSGL